MTSLSSPETRHKTLTGEMPSRCPKDSSVLIPEARRPQKNPNNHRLLVSPSLLPFRHTPGRVLFLCDCPRFSKPGRKYSSLFLPRLLSRGRGILGKHMCFASLHLPPSVESQTQPGTHRGSRSTFYAPAVRTAEPWGCVHPFSPGSFDCNGVGSILGVAFPQTPPPRRFYCQIEIAIPATQ